jgi:prepilin-type N-terminal cleavage/methylation domain-containing protein
MRKGYTLIEAIMVMAIIGIIAGIGIPIILETADAWSFASRFQDYAVQSSLVTMGRMSREMRRLRDDVSITTASSDTFGFIDTQNNAITYTRSGNSLMRNTDILANNVSGLTFTYYDDAETILATPLVNPQHTDIRLVRVELNILAGSNTLPFRFTVRPQNLRRMNEKFQ